MHLPPSLADDEGRSDGAGGADLPLVRPEGGRPHQPGRVQEHHPARQGEAQVLRGGGEGKKGLTSSTVTDSNPGRKEI